MRDTRNHQNEGRFRQAVAVGRQFGGTEALHCVWVAEDHRDICSIYLHPVSIRDDRSTPYPSDPAERHYLSRAVRVL